MKITDAMLKQIYAHGKRAYPGECFGFLLGVAENGGTARRVVAGTNLNSDRTDRFEMDPQEFVKAEKEADEAGYELVGFYHSHPDWPAIPSQTDIFFAWEENYYLIVSIHEGEPLNTTVWQIAGDSPRRFVQHPLEIVDDREWNNE